MAASHSSSHGAGQKYRIIWLDAGANQSDDCLHTQETLFRSFDNVEIFDSESECEAFVRAKSNEQILMIASGMMSQAIVPKIHGLKQFAGFYVYCMNKSKYEEWGKQYTKIRDVIVELTDLIARIRSDLKNPLPTSNATPANSVTSTPPVAVVSSGSTLKCPFEDYRTVALASLEEATAPLDKIVDKIQQMVWIVKQNCENPPHGLTVDESASIALYSMEWYTKEMTFNYILNETLRSEDREKLKPWYLYLRLFLHALSKVPVINQVVYQGKKENLSTEYPVNRSFSTWEFSNCTSALRSLEEDEEFGKAGERTLLTIECNSGICITDHAHDTSKDQVLLLPGRQFRVLSCLNAGNQLTIVQIQELDSSFTFT